MDQNIDAAGENCVRLLPVKNVDRLRTARYIAVGNFDLVAIVTGCV